MRPHNTPRVLGIWAWYVALAFLHAGTTFDLTPTAAMPLHRNLLRTIFRITGSQSRLKVPTEATGNDVHVIVKIQGTWTSPYREMFHMRVIVFPFRKQ